MTDEEEFQRHIDALNSAFVKGRVQRAALRRNFAGRRRKSPHLRKPWREGMPDDLPRECSYCGDIFVPDLSRRVRIPGAPLSVINAHRRCHCSRECDETNLEGLKYRRIDYSAIFERDGWTCYLCGQNTPKELRGFGYVPNAPSIDHVVPKGQGTNEADNLRCCCKRCNLEKGTLTLWGKAQFLCATHGLPSLFSRALGIAAKGADRRRTRRSLARICYLQRG